MFKKLSVNWPARSRPASLTFTLGPFLVKSSQSNQASRVRICLLTAPGVMLSNCAALLKEPSRAAASKARSAYRGGKDMAFFIVILSHIKREFYPFFNPLQ